jgi:flagella basal body P-ring formation protein FlgA
MSYRKIKQKREVEAEARLPLRKLLVLSVLWLLSNRVSAHLFQQQVGQDIKRYSQQQNWKTYDAEVVIWLPNKADNLPDCESTIQYQRATPNNAPIGRVNYLISCTHPNWKIRAHAKVKIGLDVWHAKTDINPNQILKKQDIQLQRGVISRHTQRFITSSQQLINQQTKRRIRSGKIILPSQLQQRLLVERGDEVIIKAGSGSFVVSMKGKAQQNGQLGDKIYIKNLSSGNEIQAKIIASGVVETLF